MRWRVLSSITTCCGTTASAVAPLMSKYGKCPAVANRRINFPSPSTSARSDSRHRKNPGQELTRCTSTHFGCLLTFSLKYTACLILLYVAVSLEVKGGSNESARERLELMISPNAEPRYFFQAFQLIHFVQFRWLRV